MNHAEMQFLTTEFPFKIIDVVPGNGGMFSTGTADGSALSDALQIV